MAIMARPSSARRTKYQFVSVLIAALVALAACAGQHATANSTAHTATATNDKSIGVALLGTWQSKECETVSQDLTRRRTYVFGKGDVAVITYNLYGSPSCNKSAKLFTLTTHGTAAFVGPSTTVAGASNVLFTFKSRAAEPTAIGVAALKEACPQYKWAPGVSVDLSQDGCGALVQSNVQCPIEYDLAAIVSGVAFFGDRSHPLCTEATRPTKLAVWGLVRNP